MKQSQLQHVSFRLAKKKAPSAGALPPDGVACGLEAPHANQAQGLVHVDVFAQALCFVDAEGVFDAELAARHVDVFVILGVAVDDADPQF